LDSAIKSRNDRVKIRGDHLQSRNHKFGWSFRDLIAESIGSRQGFQKSKMIPFFGFALSAFSSQLSATSFLSLYSLTINR
ncbi:MAG: hypothetical protein JW932_15020, partial [Deltaproteobacteria bacterium]|nr:hypothetical protein [Deltaproteobacteria bacterium]